MKDKENCKTKFKLNRNTIQYLTTVGKDSEVRSINAAHPAATPSFDVKAKPLIKLPLLGISVQKEM